MYFILPNQNRSTSRLRWAVLVWLVVCQFPIPMAHSHEHHGEENGWSPTSHLFKHHSGQVLEPDAFHWHFVIPWDLACGLGDEADPIAPPLTCCHSSDAPSPILDSAADPTMPVSASFQSPWTEFLIDVYEESPPLVHGVNFLQSFASVPMTQLTCVFLF